LEPIQLLLVLEVLVVPLEAVSEATLCTRLVPLCRHQPFGRNLSTWSKYPMACFAPCVSM